MLTDAPEHDPADDADPLALVDDPLATRVVVGGLVALGGLALLAALAVVWLALG